MRRYFRLSLICILTFACLLTCAVAAGPDISSLGETELNELYSEIQSQIMLNALENRSSYQSLFSYDDFERNPDRHKEEKITFSGRIIQVTEGDNSFVNYRIAMDGDNDRVFLVDYRRPEKAEHLLTDDTVSVYGSFAGVYTYNSTANLSVTVPYCLADLVIRPVTDKTLEGMSEDELIAAADAANGRLTAGKQTGKPNRVTKSNYEDYARNERNHEDENITFRGKVLQVLEYELFNTLRVAVDGDSDKVFYITALSDSDAVRILEDDQVTVTGKYTGLYTYTSIRGGEITIPSCTATDVSLKDYKAPKNFTKDKAGNTKLTSKLLEDYSRRPGAHKDEKITFSAKVLQVIEGSDSSAYRMAVDSKTDNVIYVTISHSDRSERVLENDKVNVTGTFDGLMSYESTLGATITIPGCVANSITVPGKKRNNTTSKDKEGRYKVTKKNYEAFARDEATYLNAPISFSAKVVQVSEGYGETSLRLAVDKSSKCMFYAILKDENRKIRILEDDTVEISGISTGLFSYRSTLGGKITIPGCTVESYTIKGYTPADVGKPDDKGYYKITKKNYDEYARNPDPYAGKKITFKAKVLQVVERSNGENIYRVAVDSDSGRVFYVEYTLPSGASRILEKDKVTLKGTFYGIYTYTTTLGASVSVPAILADSMRK